MQVINIIGPPGAGKSTAAAGLFWLMKQLHLDVELVTEFTKDLIYENSTFLLGNELLVFAEKYRRIRRLEKVDYVITDSPLLNSVFYARPTSSNARFYQEIAQSFDNLYVLLSRASAYVSKGRLQSEDEADRIGADMRKWLTAQGIPHLEVAGDASAPLRILRHFGLGQLALDLEHQVSYDELLKQISPPGLQDGEQASVVPPQV